MYTLNWWPYSFETYSPAPLTHTK